MDLGGAEKLLLMQPRWLLGHPFSVAKGGILADPPHSALEHLGDVPLGHHLPGWRWW